MNDILQWIVSTLAGIAVGVGLAKMQWRSKRAADTRSYPGVPQDPPGPRPPLRSPPPPHVCRFVFEGMGVYRGSNKFRAGYKCRVCKAFADMPAHRSISRNDYFRKSSHD
jgi:hypothetical protein